MLAGAFALFERSLRVDARALVPHVARFGLMICIYGSVIVTLVSSATIGAPGLSFFNSIAYLNCTFVSLLGISYFSTAITEEKEEDTLGLMLMAGISPLGILLGKSGGRFVQALLLIAVQYPFALLAITMGGITHQQIGATYVALFAYVTMLAGIGLLCSTVSSGNRIASFRLLMVLIGYFFAPLICGRVAKLFSPTIRHGMEWIGDSCIFFQIEPILSTGFGESFISHQVISNLVVGGAGFVGSWLLFGIAASEPSTEGIKPGLLTRTRGLLKVFSPGRPWSNPIAWKDFYFFVGGKASFYFRFFAAFGVYLFAWVMDIMFWPADVDQVDRVTGGFLFYMLLAISIDAGNLVVRSLNEEIRAQTLTTLLLLPTSAGSVLYSKLLGSLIVWLPGAFCLLAGIGLLPGSGKHIKEFFDQPAVGVWFLSLLLLLPHLAAAFALVARWGALPIAIGATIGCFFLSVVIFDSLQVSEDSVVFAIAALGLLTTSAVCHVFVRLRTDALSTR